MVSLTPPPRAFVVTSAVLLLGAAAAGLVQTAVVSPEIGPDRRVTFRFVAPAAERVQVLFAVSPTAMLARDSVRLEMRREGDVWTVVTDSLPSDIYAYQFLVDGKGVSDPSNPRVIEEYSGVRTSAFAVPGAVWTTPAARAGEISRHAYASSRVNRTEEFVVYTPPGYDRARSEPYPVLYLLHGMGDNEHTLVTNGAVNVSLDNLIADGSAVPMVVVMPPSYGGTGAALAAIDGLEASLVKAIMPAVEEAYHVARTRDGRAIAGVSMGGSHALALALRHPDRFGWVGSLSGAFQLSADYELDRRGPPSPDRFSLIYLTWGADDELAAVNRYTATGLSRAGARVTSSEVAGVGHSWTLWREKLGELAQLLFKPVRE